MEAASNATTKISAHDLISNPRLKAQCKIGVCPPEFQLVQYLPSVGGNLVYMCCFIALLIPQVWFGIRHKTWTFLGSMFMGLVLEILGYAGRLMLHTNPFIMNNFLV